MFKKIEIWILYLTILFSILFAIGFGVLVRQELVGSIKAGWVSKTALTLSEIPVNLKKIIGSDLQVEDRFPNLDGFNGTPNSEESYLLLSRYDGDLQEGVVELVDLRTFEILHSWNPDIDAFNDLVEQVDEFKYLKRDSNNARVIPTVPMLKKDLNLLFNQLEGPKTVINECSSLVYQIKDNIYHHSNNLDSEQNFWSPSYLYPITKNKQKIGIKLRQNQGYFNDAIVKISSSGDKVFEKSVSQIFIDNGLEYLLFSVGDSKFTVDPIHLNDIQPVNFDGEFWKKGDVFLSLRHQSMVLLYRPSTNEILWKGTGPFFYQHDIDILDDHRISIFNNNAKTFSTGTTVDGTNEVLIYDFSNQRYSSYLRDSLINQNVKTPTNGLHEILPNGDLFIEETDYGRTLYFNEDGSLRWTHVNRAEDGNVYLVGWSTILFTQEDIQTVNNFLTNKGTCNE